MVWDNSNGNMKSVIEFVLVTIGQIRMEME